MLPLIIRTFLVIDLVWNALAAAAGPEHALVLSPIGQLAVVGAGTIAHEVVALLASSWKAVRRRWRQR